MADEVMIVTDIGISTAKPHEYWKLLATTSVIALDGSER